MRNRMIFMVLLVLLASSCTGGVCIDREKQRPLPFPHAFA